MSTFEERFSAAFNAEARRRRDAGEPTLTKTMVWKAAGATSGAFSQWYGGQTTATLDRCLKMAPLLRVSGYWLFDETGEKSPDAKPHKTTTEASPVANQEHAPYMIDVSHASKRVRAIISRLIEQQDNETLIGLVEHTVRALTENPENTSDEQNRDRFNGNINASRINISRRQQKSTKSGRV